MTDGVKDIYKIEIPVEKVILGVEKVFSRDKWLTKEASNVALATQFALEDIIYRFWFESEEFKKSREALVETGKYSEATFITNMATAFSTFRQKLGNNAETLGLDPRQKATREVIEKIVRTIGKKVVAELGVDNEFMPTLANIYALK